MIRSIVRMARAGSSRHRDIRMTKIIERLVGHFRYRRVVKNLFDAPADTPRALIFYKTSPFFYPSEVRDYSHTNSWEIVEICRIVAGLGYAVDVVDRSETEWLPEDEYQLFIGIGAGNSGSRYPAYAERVSGLRVLYAAGPEPELANRLVLERYQAFRERTGIDAAPMRVMDRVDVNRNVAASDAVLNLDSNGFSSASWSRFGLPVHTLYPSTSPACKFDPDWFASRDRKNFLCFAGNGFIAKGVDLLVEAMAPMEQYTLHIAGPPDDVGFWDAYGDLLKRSPNIVYEGFLPVTGRRFEELCGTCSYVILPAAAEASSTAIATTMRCGLVPVTTYETGIELGDFGYLLPSGIAQMTEEIQAAVRQLGAADSASYRERVEGTLRSAERYNQASFTATFTEALSSAVRGVSAKG